MASFTFDDFARTTLGAATNRADGSPLSVIQIDNLIGYLKSPGSGPDSATSYAEYLDAKMRALPPELPPGIDYVGYSGTDSGRISNYLNATIYRDDLSKKAGIIGDTPWGDFIKELDEHPARHPEFTVMERKLQRYMDAHGVEPFGKSYSGALQDMMWNAGSPRYFENAIATGKPLVAFVENAKIDRGFSNFELTTALEHPHVRINGYPVSAFGPEPLAFVSKSAAEYQALERAIAQEASTNSGHPVSVAQVRAQLKPIDGYDAARHTLFSRPVNEFKALSLGEMSHVRADWVASRASVAPGPRLYADVPEPLPHAPGQPGAPRGPPGLAATAAEVAADSAPHSVGAGVSPAMKVAGVAGVALLAHDFATSGHKWVTLNSQGNAAGADSTAAHFVGRNVGGALGGFGAGAGVGLATGSWTGPGALLVGLGGGVLGAYLGEAWADQKDIDRIYTQVDAMGRTWTRDPTDEDGRWQRGGYQQQVQGADLGAGVEVRPVQTALGDDVTVRTHYVATGALERQLNWKAATASYELGLRAPPPPQNPYRLNASGEQSPPRAAFETERSFVRDPLSQQWELEIKEVVDGRVPLIRHEPVSAERAQALDEQSRMVIAQNAANTPAAIAARYMVAYEQQRWSDFGDAEHPSVPLAIQDAQRRADTLQASDGNSYTRQEDGQWISKGVILDSTANRNVSEELDVTWRSQMSGVAGLNAMAEEIRTNLQLAPEGVRGQVAALYERHGIERSAEQLAATAAAVEQNLSSTERQGDLVLELIPDPRTHAPSAESAIAAFGDAGGNRMVLTATTTMEDVAKIQALHQQSVPAQVAAEYAHVPTLETVTVGRSGDHPVPEAPELRIAALSPQEWEAHQQALREANRQGASIEEAAQAATLAALQVREGRMDAVRSPSPALDGDRPPPAPPASTAAPQVDAEMLAARHAAVASEGLGRVAPLQDAPRPTQAPALVPAEDQRLQREAVHASEGEADRTQGAKPQHPAQTVPPASEPAGAPLQQAPPAAEQPRHEPPHGVSRQEWAAQPGQSTHAQMQDGRVPTTADTGLRAASSAEVRPGAAPDMESDRLAAPAAELAAQHAEEARGGPSAEQPLAVERPEARVISEQDQAAAASLQISEQQEPHLLHQHAAPATPLTPLQPQHPDHALYQQIRQQVTELDAAHGRSFDETSERLTGSLLVLAKSNGLERVDHVVLSGATADQRAGYSVFVVQGELDNPGHLRAGMPTQQAVQTPFEESLQQFDLAAQEQQERAKQVALQQDAEDQRVQQEMQVAAASMGY
ncbi:XVIPCD domain-containing protein [Stenotrophomonas rhizophila]|uniref:XVIPCD domain-containing protein n=1 Tax=Stenotrophomonas rhizophila TaxID=216778 RepID=UPI001E3B6D0E|nr:XVIPCD domain-containing protein [Stenotrophomonas rhizophila]MCC7634191.1 hypothetical protein [Stenotrophomonas rhizophila]MCC7662887.1 hypothetical protein [Stenotrophomonas rhizophila]